MRLNLTILYIHLCLSKTKPLFQSILISRPCLKILSGQDKIPIVQPKAKKIAILISATSTIQN